MAQIDLGKVSVTLGGEWSANTAYEKLTIVTRKGGSYVSLADTQGQDPLTTDAWQKIASAGESLYQLMVDEGRFVGTLEEFLDQYEDTLQAAHDAAESTAQTNREVTQAEQGRVTNENNRVSAEQERVSEEQTRAQNEQMRIRAEQARETAETQRQSEFESAQEQRASTFSASQTDRQSDYQESENSRDTSYQAAETTRNNNYRDAESIRQTAFGTSESTRQTAYETAEGTSASVAGDGSRWGAYKTAEAARDALMPQNYVSATQTQDFSDTQKATARNNIGVETPETTISREQVLVEAVASLQAQVDGLRKCMENMGNLKAETIDLAEMPKICGDDFITLGGGAPAIAPRTKGVLYIDTTSKNIYYAESVTSNSTGWKKLV